LINTQTSESYRKKLYVISLLFDDDDGYGDDIIIGMIKIDKNFYSREIEMETSCQLLDCRETLKLLSLRETQIAKAINYLLDR
jgi:hypothetical protein